MVAGFSDAKNSLQDSPKESDDDIQNMRIEQALSELERIVTQLEQGKLELEDSLVYCNRAWKLANYCENKLNSIEKKLEILRKKNEKEAEFVPDESLKSELEQS